MNSISLARAQHPLARDPARRDGEAVMPKRSLAVPKDKCKSQRLLFCDDQQPRLIGGHPRNWRSFPAVAVTLCVRAFPHLDPVDFEAVQLHCCCKEI